MKIPSLHSIMPELTFNASNAVPMLLNIAIGSVALFALSQLPQAMAWTYSDYVRCAENGDLGACQGFLN